MVWLFCLEGEKDAQSFSETKSASAYWSVCGMVSRKVLGKGWQSIIL